MNNNNYINESVFKEHYKNALINIGIQRHKAEEFINSNIRLRDIGVCSAIAPFIDDYMKNIYSGYDASLSYETIAIIYEWNKKQIYEFNKNS